LRGQYLAFPEVGSNGGDIRQYLLVSIAMTGAEKAEIKMRGHS